MPLFKNISRYLSAPAHTVNSNYHIVAIALGLAVYLILAVLQPFGINEGCNDKYFYLLGFGVITYVGSVIPTAIMHRIYKSEVAEGRFSNGKNIAAFLLSVLLIMIGNFLYFKFLNPNTPTMSMLWAAVWQTLVIAVLLVGVYMTFDNARLRREIERVQQINDRLSQKNIAAAPAQTAASAPIVPASIVPASTVPAPAVETQNFASLQPNSVQTSQSEPIQSTKNNDTTINPDTLLYIESDKNYCKITTADGTSVLRSTLTTLENQLKPCGHVIRCHRAFLVNLLSVEGILGSASNGYKLKIKGHELTVPVSRTYIGNILGYFER